MYNSYYMRFPEQPNLQKVELYLPWAGVGGKWEVIVWVEFSLEKDEKVLKIDSSESCTT